MRLAALALLAACAPAPGGVDEDTTWLQVCLAKSACREEAGLSALDCADPEARAREAACEYDATQARGCLEALPTAACRDGWLVTPPACGLVWVDCEQ